MISSMPYSLDEASGTADSSLGLFALGDSGTPKEAGAVYEYDNRNNMIKAVSGSDTTLSKYNGDGLRVEKKVNGNACHYAYEYDKIVLEVDGSNTQTARNIYGLSLVKRTAGAESYSYLYNGHGDVTALLNSSGNVATQYYYDAFGVITEETATVNNPYRYAGYQYDEESELYYLKARHYNPSLARFMQEDSYRGSIADPLSLNYYTYCNNKPLMYHDPTGHASTFVQTRSDGSYWEPYAGKGGAYVDAKTGNIVSTTPEYTNSGGSSSSGSSGSGGSSSSSGGSSTSGNNGVTYNPYIGKYVDANGNVVTTVPVLTPGGTQPGYIYQGVTYMYGGSRPQDGWIVYAPNNVTYQMNTSLGKGTPTTVMPVITAAGVTIGGYSSGVTTMLDGSKLQNGVVIKSTMNIMGPNSYQLLVYTGNSDAPTPLIYNATTGDFYGGPYGALPTAGGPLIPLPTDLITDFAADVIATVIINGVVYFITGETAHKAALTKMNAMLEEGINSGMDCSEIAEDLYKAANNRGDILRITPGPTSLTIKIPEANPTKEPYYYHDVYTDGKYIFDPRYDSSPVLKNDYFRKIKELNPYNDYTVKKVKMK